MKPTLGYEGDKLQLLASPRYRDEISQIAGMRYNRMADCWEAPATWAAAIQTRGVFGQDLELHESVLPWATEQATKARLIETLKAHSAPTSDMQAVVAPLTEGPFPLFPQQQVDAYTLMLMGSALIGSEMRTGKSPTVIGALKLINKLEGNALPLLIVCPKSLKYVWDKFFEMWWPELSRVVVGGTPAQQKESLNRKVDVTIVNYELAMKHSRHAAYGSISLTDKEKQDGLLNKRFASVIVDEAHRLKKPSSSAQGKQTRAVWSLGDDAIHRFALTGTPVRNSPADLWPILRFVSPAEYPVWTKFVDRYCLKEWNNFGGMEIHNLNPRTEEEHHTIISTRFIRRMRPKDGAQKLYVPARIVEMEAKQSKAYKEMARQMITMVDEQIIAAPDPLQKLTRLTQFAFATPVLGEKDGRMSVVSLTMPSCKIDAMFDELGSRPGDPLVVFFESRLGLNLAAEQLEKYKVTYGAVAGVSSVKQERQRLATIGEFQDGELQVLLVKLGVGSEGLDFSVADRSLYLQRSYSFDKTSQSEDRTLGPNQTKDSVQIIDVITKDTCEVDLHRDVLGKEEMAHRTLRDKEWVLRALGV